MKKIFLALLVTAALLLGLSSCSGDLHDKGLVDNWGVMYWLNTDTGWSNKGWQKLSGGPTEWTTTINATGACDKMRFSLTPGDDYWASRYEIDGGNELSFGVDYSFDVAGKEASDRAYYSIKAGKSYVFKISDKGGTIHLLVIEN